MDVDQSAAVTVASNVTETEVTSATSSQSSEGSGDENNTKSTQTPGHVFISKQREIIITENYSLVKLVMNNEALQRLTDHAIAADVGQITDIVLTSLARLEWNGERILERAMTAFRLTLTSDLMPQFLREFKKLLETEQEDHRVQQLAQCLFEKHLVRLFGMGISSLVFILEHSSVDDALETLQGRERQEELQSILLSFLPQWVRPEAVWTVTAYTPTPEDRLPNFGFEDFTELPFVALLDQQKAGSSGAVTAVQKSPVQPVERTKDTEPYTSSGRISPKDVEVVPPMEKFKSSKHIKPLPEGVFPHFENDPKLFFLESTSSSSDTEAEYDPGVKTLYKRKKHSSQASGRAKPRPPRSTPSASTSVSPTSVNVYGMASPAEDIYQVIPSPIKKIGCQDLLMQKSLVHSGWLRRQSVRNRFKIFSWPQVYVIIYEGCVYCYESEVGKRPASAFSLYGYDKVYRAGEVTEKEATWAFKVVHVNPDYRCYLFSASSEKEMFFWMSLFKREMLRANGKLPRSQGDSKSFDAGVYQEVGSVTLEDYMDIEASFYDDSRLCILPDNYTNKKEEDDSDDEMDRLVTTRPDLWRRPPQPPPVPDLPPKTLPGLQAQQQAMTAVTRDLQQMQLRSQSPQAPVSTSPRNIVKVAKTHKAEKDSEPMQTRGSPDGRSIKQEPSDIEEYWSAIYFYGGREKAEEIMRQMPYEGVYLVRVNDDSSMVLHVYANEVPRKFQIFELGGKFTLKKDSGIYFEQVEDLIYFYHTDPLPGLDVRLSECYVYHPDYSTLRLA